MIPGIAAMTLASGAVGADTLVPGSGGVATGAAFSSLSAAVILVAFALLLVLLLRGSVSQLRLAVGRGLGRRRMRRILRRRSPDVLENFIIPGAWGGLTKIDCAVLTAGGILCIQTKHLRGIVFGNEKEPQWKHVEGVRQRRFLNPVIQNEGRARALQKIVPDVPVASLIVFTGPAQLTAPKVRNAIRLDDLDGWVSRFVFGPARVKDWDAVWLTVKSAALTDEASRRDFQAQLSFS
jgi:hypothetical protein